MSIEYTLIISTQLGWDGAALVEADFLAAGLVVDFLDVADIIDGRCQGYWR